MAAKKEKPKRVVSLAGTGRLAKVKISRVRWKQALKGEKRSNAIMQSIGFDIMLARIIGAHFIRQRKKVEKLTNGINMIQKARLANILGLIDKTVFSDLEQIHEIRNKFGHSFEASFAHTEVLRFVRKLSTTKGQEVTEKNSYRFYERATLECVDHLTAYWADKNPKV